MIKSLLSIVLIITVTLSKNHHKHKSKSVHFPKSHVVEEGLLRKYNAHSIHRHQGGDDDIPEVAPSEKIEEPPQTADEDGVEAPPAVKDDLLFRLSKKSREPQPLPVEESPQTADEDGVEPPPAVEEEPQFSVSKKTKKKNRKKFGSIAAPPQPVEESPQTADEDGIEPPPAVEEEDNNNDDNNGDSRKKRKKSKVLPFVYFAPFLLVSLIVALAFLVKFYFDKNVKSNKLLSVDEKNENAPLIPENNNDYQAIH